MDSKELYNIIMDKRTEVIPEKDFVDLQKLMLEEICEAIIASNDVSNFSTDQLILSAITALQVSQSLWKGTVEASLLVGDDVNVNYRGQTFTYKK